MHGTRTREGARRGIQVLCAVLAGISIAGCGGGGDVDEPAASATERLAGVKLPLDAPSLYFIDGTFIVIVVAGDSGAPAGFSLHWMTRADYDTYGWPTSSVPGPRKSFCTGSFSGVPGSINIYRLAARDTVSVNIGSGPDELGRSVAPACDVPLTCGTPYVFRAFAHNDPASGAAKSDFGPTAVVGTQPCDGGGGGPAGFMN
jgi:hypothetical protein